MHAVLIALVPLTYCHNAPDLPLAKLNRVSNAIRKVLCLPSKVGTIVLSNLWGGMRFVSLPIRVHI